MKVNDVLSTPIAELNVPPVTLFIGEDSVLKRIVMNRLIAGVTKDDRESHETKHTEQMANMIDEASVFGSRLVVIDFTGKWGKTASLVAAVERVKSTDDCIMIRTEEPPSGQTLDHLWAVVDCKKPANKKAREKLISLLAPIYEVKLFEDALKKMAERTEETSQIESALLTLSLVARPGLSVTLNDVGMVLREQSARKDIPRALLRHNMARVSRELSDTDSPPYVLTVLHGTLLKIYTWLEMTEAEVKEEEIAEALKIPPRFRREWRGVKATYSNRAIREVMEATADAFDAATHGRPWLERLQKVLTKLD